MRKSNYAVITQIMRRMSSKAVVVSLAATLSCGGVFIWIIQRDNGGLIPVNSTRCTIQILDANERMRRANAYIDYIDLLPRTSRPPGSIPRPPVSEADNPILLASHFAQVNFQNNTDSPILLYSISQSSDEMAKVSRAFVVDVEVRTPSGQVIQVFNPSWSMSDPSVPTANDLREFNPPPQTFALQPGEVIDLSLPILGKLPQLLNPRSFAIPDWSMRPATYTVRATVSYAEAPSGETRRVTSEPVTISVTEQHIKAAEAFWNARPK